MNALEMLRKDHAAVLDRLWESAADDHDSKKSA